MARRRKQTGSAMLEFVFTGVPLIFIWIGIVDMSLGMWNYHTLQYAVKQAGAYVSTHGMSNGYCEASSCRVEDAALVMAQYAIGMQPANINMTFTPVSSSDHTTAGTSTSCTLNNCETNTTAFPNGYGEFEIKAEYQFNNAMAMVAPGSLDKGVVSFQNPWFPAYTHQIVLF